MAHPIVVEGVWKRFRRWDPHRAMSFQEVLLRGFRWRRKDAFWALRDISFELPHGRMVGLIGFNGAGKSTLLRLVAGVGRPTQGRISLTGRLGAILDLGVGFHPELTGRENIIVSGVASGLTRRETLDRLDAIVAFSELDEFIEYPLRTYSSGMNLRLAFSVAAFIEPEVLLIDEVLAVGDAAFQRKCYERLVSFKDRGCTGMVVSHETEQVVELCDDAIWLDHGEMVAYGPARDVVDQYMSAALAKAAATAAAAEDQEAATAAEVEATGGVAATGEVEATGDLDAPAAGDGGAAGGLDAPTADAGGATGDLDAFPADDEGADGDLDAGAAEVLAPDDPRPASP